MFAGYSKVSIVPPQGKITLCGFAARCNKPAEGVDDDIFVHALVFKDDNGQAAACLAFDLLGLSEEMTEQVHKKLDSLQNFNVPRSNRAFASTHTHSAPAAMKLIGCGIIEKEYCNQLVTAAADAAAAAMKGMQPAVMRIAEVPLIGNSYNRRKVMENGKVAMTQNPIGKIVRSGAECKEAQFLRFERPDGTPIMGICNWAAHACTVCGNKVSGDFPGELSRQLSARFKMPFVYLQGASGDLNPPFKKMNRQEMLDNVAAIMAKITAINWSEPVSVGGFHIVDKVLRLKYQPVQSDKALEESTKGMKLIASTGTGPKEQLDELANVLNVEPGKQPDPEMLRYIAAILGQWSEELLKTPDKSLFEGCDLSIKVWRFGKVVFCFVGAEVFYETALAVKNAFPEFDVIFVGYGSPQRGYLPTDQALDDGGYEVDYAYRFYGHPAGFAKGSEPAARKMLMDAVSSTINNI